MQKIFNKSINTLINSQKYFCSSQRQQYLKQLQQFQGESITCKAAVAWQPNKPLDVTDVQVAPPQKGEIRVKVISNALCHTDVYTLSGQDPEGLFPSILGHEATAVVESIGKDVESVKVGDFVIPCYTPECGEPNCIFCQSKKTNLCPKIRDTQGKGVMPDGTSRFSKDGKMIHHFMGCSTFSEYTVISEISAAKINENADLNKVCVLGCGVSTGLGAVWNNCNVQPNTSVVVFGLGAVGLAVIQAAQIAGARRIVAVDINNNKKAIAQKFGATDFVNPTEVDNDVRGWLMAQEKWGYDYTFDCTGNTEIMRLALEVAHRGWGESCVIGVAAAGHELSTRPFQLVTGRVWKGTAFGGWKSRSEVPQLVNRVVTGEIPIDDYITHNYKGLEKVNESIEALHSGECLRAIVQISDPYQQETQEEPKEQPKIVSNNRSFNGYIKKVRHWSEKCQSYMNFSIYIPDQERGEKLPGVLYYLSGLTCTDENARTKSAFQEFASKHKIAVVFPDTSPRETNIEGITDDWAFGEGAGFYVDATNEKYSKHFNMYSYVAEELPSIVKQYFPVDSQKASICGHSMGGHGALVVGLRNSENYQSISAFAPISNPSTSKHQDALKKYLGDQYESLYKQYDAVELIKNNQNSDKKLKIFVDQGTKDEFLPDLKTENLRQACIEANHPHQIRFQNDYDHGYFFISTFIKDHIEYHAKFLNE